VPGSPSSRTERTREALRHAALARFLRQGVEATTVAEIAADAGVTERTFYRHYPSKHRILFADYDARLDWFRRALSVRPPAESIACSVRIAVESFPYDDVLQQIAQLRSKQLERELVQAHIRSLQADLASEIERHTTARTAATGDDAFLISVAAQCISAVMFAALEAWLASGHLNNDELSRLVDLGLSSLKNGIA
jgi:AcrR family transcriptional regulator